MKKYHYLEVKEGEKVVARHQTSMATYRFQWERLEKELAEKGLVIQFSVADQKEKVFNHLISA